MRVGAAYVVLGWLLAQVAEFAFENFGAPEWVLKSIVITLLLGLPLALFFAWAFELTPSGVKREKDVDRSRSITHTTGRKLDFVIIAALVVALGYFIWERQHDEQIVATPAAANAGTSNSRANEVTEDKPAVKEHRSIAVLPFISMSSDKEQAYFADGLTEEILNSLAKTPDLLVSARTSSFSYRGTAKPIPVIAAELGVGHILEGSIRRGGDTLRITVQLIRAADGFHVWSETFDRTMEDIIVVQEEIALRIAHALETTMDPAALERMMRSGTSSVAAYEAYLTGMGEESAARESADRFEMLKAREQFEKAIQLDPEFSAAHWALAEFWWAQSQSNQMFTELTELPRETIEANGKKAINDAIRFERDQVTKLKYRAAQADTNLDFQLALKLSVDYMEARPNDGAFLGELFNLYRKLGKNDDVARVIRHRYENHDLSRDTANAMLQSLRTVADTKLMRIIAHESMERYGNDMTLMYQAHRQLLWANDIDGASLIVPRIMNSDMDAANKLLVKQRQACAENRTSDAKKVHAKILENYGENIGMIWLAHGIMGDKEAAASVFDIYDEQLDFATLDTYLPYVHFDPTRYPNFMQALAGRGIEDREVLELPYRCNR